MVVQSSLPEEVAVNQSPKLEEGVEGSQVEPLQNHPWVGVAVVEVGYPLQVEGEGSWLAGVCEKLQVLGNI